MAKVKIWRGPYVVWGFSVENWSFDDKPKTNKAKGVQDFERRGRKCLWQKLLAGSTDTAKITEFLVERKEPHIRSGTRSFGAEMWAVDILWISRRRCYNFRNKMHVIQSHKYCINNPHLLNNPHVISAMQQYHIEYILHFRWHPSRYNNLNLRLMRYRK